MSSGEYFPNDAVSVTRARRYITTVLGDVPGETRDAVELMVSEIASNCVRHTSSPFRVAVDTSNRRIRVEVTDEGEGRPVVRSPLPTEPNGRGLRVVDLLSDRWGVDTSDQVGKTVWFEVAATGAPRAEAAMRLAAGSVDRRTTGLSRDETIRNFPEAVLLVDSGGRILMASEQAARTFGAEVEALMDARLATLLPGTDLLEAVESEFFSAHRDSGSTGSRQQMRASAMRYDGGEIEVDVRIGAVNTERDNPTVVVSVREIPAGGSPDEPDDVWRYFDVAVRVGTRLASVDNEDEAMASILPMMMSSLDWDVACLWLVSGDRRHLMCSSTWPGDGGPTKVFEDASRSIRPRVGKACRAARGVAAGRS